MYNFYGELENGSTKLVAQVKADNKESASEVAQALVDVRPQYTKVWCENPITCFSKSFVAR